MPHVQEKANGSAELPSSTAPLLFSLGVPARDSQPAQPSSTGPPAAGGPPSTSGGQGSAPASQLSIAAASFTPNTELAASRAFSFGALPAPAADVAQAAKVGEEDASKLPEANAGLDIIQSKVSVQYVLPNMHACLGG